MPIPSLRLTRGQPLFVAGTDTEVGKTFVAARLIAYLRSIGYQVAGYKPVASGCETADPNLATAIGLSENSLLSRDALDLWEAAGRVESLERVCPQRFRMPVAPPTAAAAEQKKVDVPAMIAGARWWMQRREVVVVEGAGGLMSPLADNYYNADLARELQASLLIVAPNRLGVIHHVLQTLITARHFHLPVLAVVLNQTNRDQDLSAASNAAAIRKFPTSPIVLEMGYGEFWTHDVQIDPISGTDAYLGG